MEPTWQAAACARSNARRPRGDLRRASSLLIKTRSELGHTGERLLRTLVSNLEYC